MRVSASVQPLGGSEATTMMVPGRSLLATVLLLRLRLPADDDYELPGPGRDAVRPAAERNLIIVCELG